MIETANNKHLDYLDVAKGIAIIAVVLGHSFPSNIFNGDGFPEMFAHIVYDFVYSFHMPLFFWISGFLFLRVCQRRNAQALIKKAKRLLIPYLTFSLIYIPLRIFMSSFANSSYSGFWKILIGVSPNGGVWYLYVLFLFSLVSFYIFPYKKYMNITFALSGIILVVTNLNIFTISYSVLRYFFSFYFYFLFGLKCAEKNHAPNERGFIGEYLIVKILGFIFLFAIHFFFNASYIMPIIALLGINIVLIISKRMEKSDFLKRFGNQSMEIYLLHGPIIVVLRWLLAQFDLAKIIISAILFIAALTLSLVVGKMLLHYNRITKFLFLGIDTPKEKPSDNLNTNTFTVHRRK